MTEVQLKALTNRPKSRRRIQADSSRGRPKGPKGVERMDGKRGGGEELLADDTASVGSLLLVQPPPGSMPAVTQPPTLI